MAYLLPLLACRRHVRAAAVRHFRRHAQALAQRGVGVDGLADVHGIRAHLDGQRNLADHVASVGADPAAAQNLAMAVHFRRFIKQEFPIELRKIQEDLRHKTTYPKLT